MHNEKVKKIFADLSSHMEKLAKKYGIKVVGGWASTPEHLVVMVYDAPNMEAILKLTMEPEVMAWTSYNTTETRPVMTIEEVMKLLK
jgi:uncharacterized protein with GYD domain